MFSLLLWAVPGLARAADSAAPLDRPPEITPTVRIESGISDVSGVPIPLLRSGRRARILFSAEDPDGRPITYTVAPLPAGATFDQQRGLLTWQPTPKQEGKHKVDLEVSDGHFTAKHTFTFVVRSNRAPTGDGSAVTYSILQAAQDAAGFESRVATHLAGDPDGDDVTCEIRKAPPGASVVVSKDSAMLVWSPTTGDIGEHEIVVDVSDGELHTTIRKTIVVMPEWEGHKYRRWFLIGGGPSAFVSHGDGEAFLGGTIDITLVALREDGTSGYACQHGMHEHECHASHHRFYAQFEVLDSMRSSAASLFTYAAGYSASLEWKPARRYLIPHYGIDVGGLVRDGVGHRAQVHPYLGAHLWASDALWVDATLGYRVTPAELLDLSGPTLALRAILNPW